MPPRKKGPAAPKKENVKSEPTATRKSARGKKVVEPDPKPEPAEDETVIAESEVEGPGVKGRNEDAAVIEISSSQDAIPNQDKKEVKPAMNDLIGNLDQPGAATDPKYEGPPSPIARELEGRAVIESSMGFPAVEGGAPDIVGVIEDREDEDIAVDDTEPAPMDDEERRRILERPTEARDTSDVPVPLPESNGIQKAMQAQGMPAKEAIAQYKQGSFGELQSLSAINTAPTVSASSKQERMAKMIALRKKMNDSAQANRKEVIAAQNEHRKNIAESKRLERKRLQAAAMGEKLDALETGEDLERKRNWEYSLEDNERWSKKQDRKDRRADHGFASYDDSARRKYKRDMDAFKPDLNGYREQRERVLGLDGDTSVAGMEILQGSSSGQLIPGSEQLYRDANSFVYADHKPSDDAIDRVIQQINVDIDKRAKRSRVRHEEEEDITYINDKNKVFNKKLERFFSKYTGEIKNNFERGTAL